MKLQRISLEKNTLIKYKDKDNESSKHKENKKADGNAKKSSEPEFIEFISPFDSKETTRILNGNPKNEYFKLIYELEKKSTGYLIHGYDQKEIGPEIHELSFKPRIEEIVEGAFKDVINITKLKISQNIVNIEPRAFAGCKNLEEITVVEGNPIYGSPRNCDAIIKKDNGELVLGCKNTRLLSDTKSIGDYAFEGMIQGESELNNLTISNAIQHLGEGCFKDCSSITKVIINKPLKVIPLYIFSGCSNLAKVKIKSNFEKIGNNAFERCSCLNEFALPESCREIGDEAFMKCKALKKLEVDKRVLFGVNMISSCTKIKYK